MVKISGYAVRTNKEGEDFVALLLQGDLVMVQSLETGRYYATAKKCSIASTFTEEQAATFVGQELPGRIIKVEVEPYEFTVEETGEAITLSHRWEFLPEGASNPVPMHIVKEEEEAA